MHATILQKKTFCAQHFVFQISQLILADLLYFRTFAMVLMPGIP